MSEVVVELVNVSKTYATRRGDEVVALADTSLTINRGQFVTIVGPSGCGKSTLLNIISGLSRATSGKVAVHDAESADGTPRVGMVFQEPTLLLWRDVLDNILLPVEIDQRPVREFRPRARELLETLGLKDFADAYPHELSGGMQQRVAIARALVLDPALLLMDEPFSAVDAFTRERLTVELLRVWERNRKTVMFVTHNIPEAVFLADRLIVMGPRPGRVLADIDIAVKRPRDSATLDDADFHRHVAEVRRILQISGSLD
jgi:NitT/TauT family transport system ATP-binding protein